MHPTSSRTTFFSRLSGVACIIAGIVLLGARVPCTSAATIQLAWEQSAGEQVAGYNIYYGTESREYAHVIDAGNTTAFGLTDFPDDAVYYIAVTAYTGDEVESEFSEEVQYIPPAPVVDRDGDGFADDVDNCPDVHNPGQ